MSSPGPSSDVGKLALSAVLEHPADTLIGVDFDGTLAPIIDNPEEAFAHPAAVIALARLGRLVGAVAVITGRPARTAVHLGGFRDVPGLVRFAIQRGLVPLD